MRRYVQLSLSFQTHSFTSTALKKQNECGNMTTGFKTGMKLLFRFPVEKAKLPNYLSDNKLVLPITCIDIYKQGCCMNPGVKVRSRPTDGLSQSNHHLLAGGCLRDPADDPLDSIHPHLQLHVVSEARRPVVVRWPRHH